ncbi:hypothetical protein M758_4G091400 [Ceratodon purpureus]|nr:hypothetical protein M758_4G091400 [Ceratodon purpureus]
MSLGATNLEEKWCSLQDECCSSCSEALSSLYCSRLKVRFGCRGYELGGSFDKARMKNRSYTQQRARQKCSLSLAPHWGIVSCSLLFLHTRPFLFAMRRASVANYFSDWVHLRVGLSHVYVCI